MPFAKFTPLEAFFWGGVLVAVGLGVMALFMRQRFYAYLTMAAGGACGFVLGNWILPPILGLKFPPAYAEAFAWFIAFSVGIVIGLMLRRHFSINRGIWA